MRGLGLATGLLLAAAALRPAAADWLTLTGAETAANIAEVTILDDRVAVALEVSVDDLETFAALIPDDWLAGSSRTVPPLAERLAAFSAETLQIMTGDGTRLPARLTLAEPRLRKDRASPGRQPPADKRVLYAELAYPFEGRPERLTFIPPSDDQGRVAATIGFIVFHETVPVIDFRYLSAPETVTLDWEDPWYSRFNNPNLKRHHDSPLMSFLYVEPREVRHEVLIRVRDLEDWTNLGPIDGAKLSPAQQARIADRAARFFATRNPLSVDGASVQPADARAAFLSLTVSGPQVIEDRQPLDPATALLGVILSYPVARLPQAVTLRWELFNERIREVPATAIDPAGPFAGSVAVEDPTLEWRNHLKQFQEPRVSPVVRDRGAELPLPALFVLAVALGVAALAAVPLRLTRLTWLAVALIGAVVALVSLRLAPLEVPNPFAGPPDEAAAAEILAAVIDNLNHPTFEIDPLARREALGLVVAGEALPEVEAELGRAFALDVAGGGQARIAGVEELVVTEVAPLGQGGFRALAAWRAEASAGHWGHRHRRTLAFRAYLDLVERDGAWKLAGITVLEAKQES